MQDIGPCLWFDHQAEDAANFYVSVFKDAKILDIKRYGEGLPLPAGTVMTVRFVLNGIEFVGLNGGPMFQFTPAVSFMVNCETQEEVDDLWQKLCEGGKEGQCGWLVDKFGVSWQVIPKDLPKIFDQSDPAASKRAVAAMMTMKKLDMVALQKAYDTP